MLSTKERSLIPKGDQTYYLTKSLTFPQIIPRYPRDFLKNCHFKLLTLCVEEQYSVFLYFLDNCQLNLSFESSDEFLRLSLECYRRLM